MSAERLRSRSSKADVGEGDVGEGGVELWMWRVLPRSWSVPEVTRE